MKGVISAHGYYCSYHCHHHHVVENAHRTRNLRFVGLCSSPAPGPLALLAFVPTKGCPGALQAVTQPGGPSPGPPRGCWRTHSEGASEAQPWKTRNRPSSSHPSAPTLRKDTARCPGTSDKLRLPASTPPAPPPAPSHPAGRIRIRIRDSPPPPQTPERDHSSQGATASTLPDRFTHHIPPSLPGGRAVSGAPL